jgi:hypothetical protein
MILPVVYLGMNLEAILNLRSQHRGLKVNKVPKVETRVVKIEEMIVMPWRVDLKVNSKKTVKTLERLQSFLLSMK